MMEMYSAGSELEMPSITHASLIVFVVDDDVSIRESLGHLLRCEGWHSETFASASEFLAAPPPSVPSCLVLDVSMPGLNGFEFQKRVASDRPGMPIVLITAHGDIPMSVKAMKAGANRISHEAVYQRSSFVCDSPSARTKSSRVRTVKERTKNCEATTKRCRTESER